MILQLAALLGLVALVYREHRLYRRRQVQAGVGTRLHVFDQERPGG